MHLAVDRLPGALRVAVTDGARPVDLYQDRADRPEWAEAVVAARVVRPVPSLGGSFIDLGPLGEGFLKRAQPAAGSHVAVQLRDPGRGGKPPTAVAELGLAGRLAVVEPARSGLRLSRKLPAAARSNFAQLDLPAGIGLRVRSAAGEAGADAVAGEAARLGAAWAAAPAPAGVAPGTVLVPAPDALARALRDHPWPHGVAVPPWCRDWAAARLAELAPDLADRLAVAPEAVGEAGWDEAIAGALAAEVPLPGGGRLAIEATRALTAVDVDAGNRPGSRRDLARAAVTALAGELRRRNLAGLVAIDLPRQDERGAEAARQRLAQLGAADPARPRVLGYSPAGLLELSRPRRGRPLADFYAGDAAAVDTAFAACRAVAGYTGPAARLALTAGEAVAAQLGPEGWAGPALAAAQAARHVTVAVRIEPGRAAAAWELDGL